jgi:hypothetical protein
LARSGANGQLFRKWQRSLSFFFFGVLSFVGTASCMTWMKWDTRRALDASGCTDVCAAGGSADADAGAQLRAEHTHQAT